MVQIISNGGTGGDGAGSQWIQSSVATSRFGQWENDGDGYINLKFTTATDQSMVSQQLELLLM